MSILVATDLSPHSRQAVRWAAAEAAATGVPLLVVHVIEALGDNELWTALFETPDEIEQRVLKNAVDSTREFLDQSLVDSPVPDERKILVAVGSAPAEIDRFAKKHEATLVVSGTTGHGALRNALFGSTARRLTHEISLPTVFVPPESPLPPPRKIVLAVDFSHSSDAALRWAAQQATRWGAQVTAVHGLGVSALSPDYEPSANFVPMVETIIEEREAKVRARLASVGLEGDVLIERAGPAESILEAAKAIRAELIVMGTHGRGPLGRIVLGSVASRVLRHPDCAVVTVHDAND